MLRFALFRRPRAAPQTARAERVRADDPEEIRTRRIAELQALLAEIRAPVACGPACPRVRMPGASTEPAS